MAKLTVLGARGSMPVSGKEYLKYGGNTSCILLEGDSNLVILDAGTGLSNLRPESWKGKKVHLFLSHLHMDHIMGIPTCPMFFDRDADITIYAPSVFGDVEAHLNKFMARPFWPVGTEVFQAQIKYVRLEDMLVIAGRGLTVAMMETDHPGGCYAYRIDVNLKRIIYATDMNIERSHSLITFCRNADIMFIDGQYTPEEYEMKSNFGHSDMKVAWNFMKSCNVKKGYLFHHDISGTDDKLSALEEEKGYVFAKEGDSLEI